jgi:glycosyltransferase involved in cell wall biosynthesis
MRIAVNATFFDESPFETDTRSFYDIMLQWALSAPGDDFLFIFDKPFPSDFRFPGNVTPVVAGPKANGPIRWKLWYNIVIPAFLKRHRADVFVSPKFCSSKTHIPQILFTSGLGFIHQPSFVPRTLVTYLKKNMSLFLKKADAIIVRSDFLKNELIQRYSTQEGKIRVIPPRVNEQYKPLGDDGKGKIKDTYADGNEFFVYRGVISPEQNLMNLLRAFSVFKKRQRSAMQLIVLGEPGIQYGEFLDSLKLYRFNTEVKMPGTLPVSETAKIIASAYALVYTPVYETSSAIPLEAMQCATPVISSPVGSLTELCGDAALYADPGNFKDIAEKMMMLFKDESARSNLIEKGRNRVRAHINPDTPALLQEILQNITQKKSPG